ncbi:hypothetical protein ACNKHT_16630 [Shigella flexneri]
MWPGTRQPRPTRQNSCRDPAGPGTISPWSSKATDIAHNCGLQQVNRLERGVAYYIEAGTLTNERSRSITAKLHRRHDGNGLFCFR